MAPSSSREFLLAAACSVWPPSDRRTEAIHAAAASPLDWDSFLQVIRRHRIVGLVHDGLACVRTAVPPAINREIDGLAATLLRQNLAIAAEAVRLQYLFAKADLPIVFLKGIALGMLAYGNIGLRHSKDLDLLVAPDSILVAASLLQRAGYRQCEPPATFSNTQLQMWLIRTKELRYVHQETHLEVELHIRLFDNPALMPKTPSANTLRTVSIGGDIGLCTLGEEDTFAYLCLHGAIHCWFRLKWLADIGALLARQPVGGVERLYLAADARGVGRCAAQAILLCRKLLGSAIPDPLFKTLNRSAAVRRLEVIAMGAMIAKAEPTEQALGTFWANLSHFLLDPNWRYWLAELMVQSISPVDILTLPLPAKFRLLYPALRMPLWLYRHSTHRSLAARAQHSNGPQTRK